MRFSSLSIVGAWEISVDPHEDERGLFARTYCRREFSESGIPAEFVQANTSYNRRRGTVRGLHFQWPPSLEGKLVRCAQGQVFDVLVDLRPESETYLKNESVILTSRDRNAVFIPAGVAHGFQTLGENTEVYYQMTDFYEPALAHGYRWDDPAFGIDWPLPVSVISDADRDRPDFVRQNHQNLMAGDRSI